MEQRAKVMKKAEVVRIAKSAKESGLVFALILLEKEEINKTIIKFLNILI